MPQGTTDPAARQVLQRVSVAPSPATSGTAFSVDNADDYFFHTLEQTVPFKVTVYPQNEIPTKTNAEVILVQAYSISTRTGGVDIQYVAGGIQGQGSVDIVETQPGDSSIPQPEIQTITVSATSGTYTLTFAGNTTANINWNDSAATVQTRLQALASIGSGNATVTGSAGGPYTVTFAGALGGYFLLEDAVSKFLLEDLSGDLLLEGGLSNTYLPLMTADATNLINGQAGTVTVAEITAGGAGVNEVQQVTVLASQDDGTFTLSFGGQTTDNLAWDISADSLATELCLLSSIGAGNIEVEGAAGGPYTVTFQGSLGGVSQALLTADATLLTYAAEATTEQVTIDGTGGTFRLSVDGGSNYTSALAYNASASAVQSALQGLAAVGANNCTVTFDSTSQAYTVTFCGALANTIMALTADASSLTTAVAAITSSVRAQDGTTAQAIAVGYHVEVAGLPQQAYTAAQGSSSTGTAAITPDYSAAQFYSWTGRALPLVTQGLTINAPLNPPTASLGSAEITLGLYVDPGTSNAGWSLTWDTVYSFSATFPKPTSLAIGDLHLYTFRWHPNTSKWVITGAF